jgi:hypothetical protein
MRFDIEKELRNCEKELGRYLGASYRLTSSATLEVNGEDNVLLSYKGNVYHFTEVEDSGAICPIYWQYLTNESLYKNELVGHGCSSARPYFVSATVFNVNGDGELRFVIATNDIILLGTRYVQSTVKRTVVFKV